MTDAIGLQVEENLYNLVADSTCGLKDDFELGIGRLAWRESLAALLLSIRFILKQDKCNSMCMFLLSLADVAPILGIKEKILAD